MLVHQDGNFPSDGDASDRDVSGMSPISRPSSNNVSHLSEGKVLITKQMPDKGLRNSMFTKWKTEFIIELTFKDKCRVSIRKVVRI